MFGVHVRSCLSMWCSELMMPEAPCRKKQLVRCRSLESMQAAACPQVLQYGTA